ncbi:protein phosphatase 2C domain-containing protein [Dactylosporangium sp. AC04546]|uniref:PP2C family protein-serine/threonine phosphatase n=1 Tax=Dactylosporangium sp. AC04546 TaxID=2862460 RepID=UPI001EE07A8A|nr:protein phosphatase 2C domain-containing protein [Dactylosporangium sp. AC04546]WVK81975.1 protein phosphatase 2C domain-containing protein [Dactylosporangium sp. AC04546]
MSATIRAGAATDVGKVRRRNEDSAVAGRGIWAVADGMGGHAAGDVASNIAVTALRRLEDIPDRGPHDVRDELARANEDILAAAVADPSLAGMGTTAVGLCLVRLEGADRWVVFNIGDSRVYRWSHGELDQLTVDHVAPEAVTGRRGVITRALGTDPGPRADLWVHDARAGERFLICSDGLPLEVSDADIAAVLGDCPDPQQAAEELVRRAVVAGGRDNVTVVVVDHE